MKTKILLSVAIFFFATIAANAQITEGKYLLGGSFNYYNSTGDHNNSINTIIQFGKAIKENTVVGVIGSFSGSKNNYGTSDYSIYNYSAGVFYRKYKSLGKNFYFLQEADAVFQHARGYGNYFDNVGQSLYANSNGAMLSYILGISYSATKHMQIELTMPNLANISFTNIKTVNSRLPQGVSAQKANTFSA